MTLNVIAAGALLLGLSSTRVMAQDSAAPADATAWLRHIAAEVARLRVDVLEHRIECGREKLSQLEGELRSARQEQARFETEEQGHRRELAQVEEMLGRTGDPDERSQLEGFRKQMESGALEAVRASRAGAARREGEIAEKLQLERQRIEHLNEQARRLAAWLGGK